MAFSVACRSDRALSRSAVAMATSAAPVSADGRISGSTTRRKACTGLQPSDRAASLSSGGAAARPERSETIARGMKRIV